MVRFSVSIGLLCAACSLPTVQESICGNSVTEAGEDCDGNPEDGICGQPNEGDAACRFLCDEDGGISCPAGWGCGFDGLCAQPGLGFEAITETFSFDVNQFAAGDIDQDGFNDVLGVGSGGIIGLAGDGFGFLDPELSITTQAVTGKAWFGQFGGDAGLDVVVPFAKSIGAVLGSPTDFLAPVLYPSRDLPDGVLRGYAVPDTFSGGSGKPGTPFVFNLTINPQDDTELLMENNSITLPGPLSVQQLNSLGAKTILGDVDGLLPFEFLWTYDGADEVYIFDFINNNGVPSLARSTRRVKLAQSLIDSGYRLVSDSMMTTETTNSMNQVIFRHVLARARRVVNGNTEVITVLTAVGEGLNDYCPCELVRVDFVDEADASQTPQNKSLLAIHESQPGNPEGNKTFVFDDGLWFVDPSANGGLFGPISPFLTIRSVAPNTSGQPWERASVADFNGDDLPDIIASSEGPDLSLFLSASGTAFNPYVVDTPPACGGLFVGDFDGDTISDVGFIRCISFTRQQLLISYGQFLGPLGEPVPIAGAEAFRSISVVKTGGPNDGIVDIAAVAELGGELVASILEGSTSRTMLSRFAFNTDADLATGVVAGQLTGDGARDVVSLLEKTTDAGITAAEAILLTGVGDGGGLASQQSRLCPTDPSTQPSQNCPIPTSNIFNCQWQAADIDDDGEDEIMAVADEQGVCLEQDLLFRVYEKADFGGGVPSFSYNPVKTQDQTTGIRKVEIGDINGDGAQDVSLLLSKSQLGDTLRIYANDGGLFSSDTFIDLAVGPGASDFTLADINLDGLPDVVVRAGRQVQLYVNDGDGGAELVTTLEVLGSSGPVEVADMDADGVPDLIVSQVNPASTTGDIEVVQVWLQVPKSEL